MFPPSASRHPAGTTAIIIAPGGGGGHAPMGEDPGDDEAGEMPGGDEITLPPEVKIPDGAKAGDVIEVGFRLDDPKARTGTLCSAPDDGDEDDQAGGEPPQSMSDMFGGYSPHDDGDDEN